MVGAHIEEVAPRRVVLPADAGWLALLLVASIALHAWLIGHTFVTARDSMRFARIALNLESPHARNAAVHRSSIDVMKDTVECPDPPLFPLLVLGGSKIAGMVTQVSRPEQMLIGAQLASSFAAVLLVLPSYWLGRMLFANRFAGFAAALLFQVLPTVAQVTSDGLSDSTAMLGIVSTLLCGVRAVRTRSTKWFLAAGVASGFAYLVRPEAMIGAAALGFVTVALAARRTWPLRVAVGRITALIVGAMLVAAPYMVLIGGISNKPSVNEPLKKLMPLRLMTAADNASPLLFGEWYSGHGSQTMWAFKAIAKETVKASHYVPFALGLLGIVWWRHKFDSAFAVVLTAGVLQCLLLLALAMKPMPADLSPGAAVPPYVSERHTLLLVFIACLFTGGVLEPLAKMISPFQRGAQLLLFALVASALPSALKPLHENRAGHYYAGKFLENQIGPHDAVIDPFEWAHYYAGYSLYGMPADPSDAVLKTRWVVWEPTAGTKENPHSRLPRLEAARLMINDGANPPTLVFQWPEDHPKVVVYKQVVRK